MEDYDILLKEKKFVWKYLKYHSNIITYLEIKWNLR